MTVSNIEVDFDSEATDAGAGSEITGDLDCVFNFSTVTQNFQLRFPLGVITVGSAINDSTLQWNVLSESLEAGEGGGPNLYNGTGDDDPDADDLITKYNRSNGTPLVTIDCSSTGSKTGDLGATADTAIAGNLSSPGFISFGVTPVGFENAEAFDIEAIENAGSDPATLTVDWTPPAAGTVPQLATVGVGS